MKLIFAISIVALSFFGTACRRSVGEMILVPMPQEATFTGGYFETDSARFVERAGDGYVACRIDPSAPEIRPEGYRLKVTRRGIDLTALDSAGLFYGRQTLCLLATAQGIPCVEIIDNPCFGYRGIHLDVSRHFFPVETIFRLLDEMARYKLNKFHFHLADNGGWRIRIDAYPLLTRLGVRLARMVELWRQALCTRGHTGGLWRLLYERGNSQNRCLCCRTLHRGDSGN